MYFRYMEKHSKHTVSKGIPDFCETAFLNPSGPYFNHHKKTLHLAKGSASKMILNKHTCICMEYRRQSPVQFVAKFMSVTVFAKTTS